MKVSKMPKSNKNLEQLNVQFEVKQIDDEDDEYFRFEGLASTFGNIDLVDDIVMRGAFQESIAKRIPIILWQHYSDEPIGMPEFIEEREEGLFIRVRLPKDDELVKGRVIPQIKVGSIRTMSIGFRIPKGGQFINEDGIRELIKVDLHEVSLVTFPANPMARVVDFKSIKESTQEIENLIEKSELNNECKSEWLEIIKNLGHYDKKSIVEKEDLSFLDDIEKVTARNLEKGLRDSGLFSKNAAKFLVSTLNRCDAEEDDTGAIAEELKEQLKKVNKKIDEKQVQMQLKSMLTKLGD